MKKQIAVVYIIILLLFPKESSTQDSKWINYTDIDRITALVSEGDNIWIGTDGGLVKLNKNTESLKYYTKANSGIPGNAITSLDVDEYGNVLIGTNHNGIGIFNEVNCIQYYESSYNTAITVDSKGIIWAGSIFTVRKYDGEDRTEYKGPDTSTRSFGRIGDIKLDNKGNVWIAATWGFCKVEDNKLIKHNEIQSASSLEIDKKGKARNQAPDEPI